MKEFYIVIDGKKEGPFSFDDLQKQDIHKNTLVWHYGLEDWTEAQNINELSELLVHTPPPIPQINKKITQNIKIESPIDINISRKEKYSKEELTQKNRNQAKRILSEVGIILLFLGLAVGFAFSTYFIFYEVNSPEMVSDENQALFNREYYEKSKNNPIEFSFGDIMGKYLGYYKYDEITNQSELENINAFRISKLKEKSETISWYVFYSIISLLLFIRYLVIFIKWLNPKEIKDKNTEQKTKKSFKKFLVDTFISQYEYFDIPALVQKEKNKGYPFNKQDEVNFIIKLQKEEEELIKKNVVCRYCKAIDSIYDKICQACGNPIKD